MKPIFKLYRGVAALLVAILLFSVGLTMLTGGLSRARHRCDATPVLATTYPLYVAAQNILGDDTAISLSRLDGAASGCLHDYQMSPADRKAVQDAQLILMNGAGAESFLHGIVDAEKCVDTSDGIDLLCATHNHDHGEEEHHHEEYNEHVWLSPVRYSQQVLAVMRTLISLNGANEDYYRSNAENYLRQIYEIQTSMTAVKAELEGTPCVLFHDSMSYLADDLGLDVKLTLSVEGESGLSAHDLARVELLAADHPDLLLLYDTQYALRYEDVTGTPVSVHTAVQGSGTSTDWLDAMRNNLQTLQPIIKGGDTP